MEYIYLASPYSHDDVAVMHDRFAAACEAAARLIKGGDVVFSPIAHSHPIGMLLDAESNHELWEEQDMPFLVHASAVYVLMLRGWRNSRGVAREIEIATDLGIPVIYVSPEELGQSGWEV